MLQSSATTGIRFATTGGERGSISKCAVRIVLSAQLIAVTIAVAGCGSQNFSDSRPSLTAENTPRPGAVPKRTASHQPRQTFPDQASDAPAALMPDKEETTASIPPAPTSSAAAQPDPKTVRAMNCRDLMLKQHPTVRFGSNGTANVQREFFDSCMRRAASRQD